MRYKFIIIALFASLFLGSANAQEAQGSNAALITADSLATGNYKDILSSFFQIAFNNLTGEDKELSFIANPYAILLRHNPNYDVAKYYYKYRHLRNLNFQINAKLDSSFRFNGFATGITYAIINKRDISLSRDFAGYVMKDASFNYYSKLNQFLGIKVNELPHATENEIAFYDTALVQIKRLFTDSTFTFDKLDPDIKTWIFGLNDDLIDTLKAKVVEDGQLNIFKDQSKGYDALIDEFATKPLWTVGVFDTSYSNGALFKSVQLTSTYLQGFTKTKRTFNVELNIKASINFEKDSLQTGNNLLRQTFMFEPGINFVLKGSKSFQSYMELKIGGGYSNILKGKYAAEDRIVNTINGTFRIRVLDEIWIPIDIKYDPKNGNVFGYLNVKANFKALGNMFKG